MKYQFLCVCALFAIAAVATPAQTKHSFSGKCSKPDVVQTVPAGDKDGHAFMLQQGKCDSTGEIGGANSKDATFSEHDEVTGNHTKGSGVYVQTFDSGDKIFYTFQNYGTTKDGAFVTGGGKYQITGGTGKMKGIKGTGACKLTGNADGGLDYTCEGEHTMPAAAAAKK